MNSQTNTPNCLSDRLGKMCLFDRFKRSEPNKPSVCVCLMDTLLHPHFKWKWIEKQWRERSNWIKAAKDAFNDYLFEYEHAPIDPPESSKPTPTITTPERKRRRIDDPDSDSESEDSERIKASIFEQLTAYSSDKSHKELVKDRQASPLPYWLSKRHCCRNECVDSLLYGWITCLSRRRGVIYRSECSP